MYGGSSSAALNVALRSTAKRGTAASSVESPSEQRSGISLPETFICRIRSRRTRTHPLYTMDRKEDTLHDLMDVLRKVYDYGIKSKEIHIYDTERVVDVPIYDVPYRIHVIPSLSEKPPPSDTLPDLRAKPEKDPFKEPFAPAEFLTDLDEGYHSLLNKFCFLPEQFVLVSHRWAVQADPLEAEDLWAAWRVLKAMEKAGRRGFVFANVGKFSGASQPHRHIQVLPIPDGQDRIPVEALSEQVTGGFEHAAQKPHLLPLPYAHLFTPLPSTSKDHQPAPTATASSSSTPSLSSSASSIPSLAADPTATPGPEITPGGLHEIYEAHLGRFDALGAGPEPDGARSHNVLLTLRGFHTIPRKSRDVEVPVADHLKELLVEKAKEEKERKKKKKNADKSGSEEGGQGEADEEEEEDVQIGDHIKFSINGLGFAGYFFMKPGCDQLLKEFGPDNFLKGVAYERNE